MKTSSLIISRILTVLLVAGAGFAGSMGSGCIPGNMMPGDGDGDGDGDIAFAFPRDGDVLNQADDADGDTSNGIQVDPPVRVAYEGSAGTQLTLSSDQGETATATVDDDGFARFSGFTLNGSPDGTLITLTATDGEVSDEIEVEAITPDAVRLCSITAPSNGAMLDIILDDAAINSDGFQVAVEVSCTGVDEGADVVVSVESAVAQTVQLDANGDATAVVTLPNTDAGNNSNDISIQVDGDTDLTDEVTVTVVIAGDPEVEITAPADGAALSPGDVGIVATSANVDTATYDLDCSDDANDATDVALTVDSGTGAITGTITGLSSDPPNSCTLTVTGEDSNGDTASDSVTFTVSAVAATVSFPCDADSNGYLVASEDEDTATATDMDCGVALTATFDSGTWTATAQLYDVATDMPVGMAQDLGTLASGTPATFDFTAPFSDDTAYEVRSTITDGTSTVPVTGSIRVDTVAPSTPISTVTDGVLYSLDDDGDVATPGFELSVITSTIGLAPMATIDLAFTEVGGPGSVNATITVAANLVGGTNVALADGEWSLTATSTDAAGNVGTEGPITFTVDATAPGVASIIVVDNANDDDWLNLAESGDASGSASSDVTVTFDDVEDNQTIELWVNGVSFGAATTSGNSVTFTDVPLAEGSVDLEVTGADAAGNSVGTNGRTIEVDTVAPTLTILSPVLAVLNADDDVSGDPGLQVNVGVQSNAETGQIVQLFDDTTELLPGANVALDALGGATFANVTLAEGIRDLTAMVSDLAGNTTISGAYAPNVDSIVPTPVVGSPAPGTVLTQGDDLDVAPGHQADIVVTHEAGLAAEVCIISDAEGQVGCAPADASGTTTVRVTFNLGQVHSITAQIVTTVGSNVGTTGPQNLEIVTGNYNVLPNNLVDINGVTVFGAAQDTDGGTPGAQVSISVDLPGFPTMGGVVELLVDGGTVATGTYSGSGDTWTIEVTLTDGQTGTMEITVDDQVSTTGTSGPFNFLVDIGVPTVSITAPASPVTFAIADDLQLATGGLQAQITVDIAGCENGGLTVQEGAINLITPTTYDVVAGGAETPTLNVSDASEGAGTWTVTCTDEAGNTSAPAELDTTVDITAPAAMVLTPTIVGLAREGVVQVSFTAPGDDGTSGASAQLDVVVSKTPITAGSAATLAATPRVFPGDNGLVVTSTTETPGATYAPSTTTVRLAFDATWNIAVLATDDVGNTSFATVQEAGLTTTASTVTHAEDDVGDGAAVNDQFGQPSPSPGDIDGDGVDDLLIAAAQEGDTCVFGACRGVVRLWSGRSDLGALAAAAPDQLVSPVGHNSFGSRATIVPSIDGDAFDDVVVYSYDEVSFEGLVTVLYGKDSTGDGLLTEAPITFNVGFDYIDGIRSIGDVDGDGFNDLLLTPFNGFNQRQAKIIFGSSTRITDGSAVAAVRHAILEETRDVADTTVRIRAASALGNLNGDDNGGNDLEDFVVNSRHVGFSVLHGMTTWPTPPATVDLATAAVQSMVCNNDDCGRETTAGDVDGDGEVDIVANGTTTTGTIRIYLQDAGTFPSVPSYYLDLPSATLAGYSANLAVGDVNGDGRADVSVARLSPSSIWVFLGGDQQTGNRTTADTIFSIAFDGGSPGFVANCGDLNGSADGVDEICYSSRVGTGTFVIRN
jgi:hypothetical protein